MVAAVRETGGRLMSRRPGFPARLELPSARPAPVRKSGSLAPVRAGTGAEAGQRGMPGGVGLDSQAVRARMVEKLAAQGIADPRVLAAMGKVERHRFVDSALVNQAYEDTSLPIGLGQTISKPNVVARMIELLLGGRTDAAGKLGRVLEIGTGCGYQAAVLSMLATEVYSIERLRGLHEKARDNLRPFRLPNRASALRRRHGGLRERRALRGHHRRGRRQCSAAGVGRAACGGRAHRRAHGHAQRCSKHS